MELTFAQQSVAFGWSLILGLGLAVFYGALKFLRYAFSLGRAAVLALDIFFMLVWALSVFFFSLAFLMGFIRVHVIAESLGGFLLYRLTAGRLVFRIYSPVIRFLKKILKKISLKLKIIAKYLLKIVGQILYNIINKKQRKAASDPENGEPGNKEIFLQSQGENNSNSYSVIKKRKKHEVKKAKNQKGSGNR